MKSSFLCIAVILSQFVAALYSSEAPSTIGATNNFINQVTEHFNAWDQDKNGQLSLAELDTAAGSEKIVGGEAAAVAALKRALNTKNKPAPTLTLEGIIALSKAPPLPLNGTNLPKMYAEGLSKIGRAKRVLFETEYPQLEALHQGRLGDCFCLAPLGAMLHRDPRQVAEMFHLQPDGKCAVVLGKKTVTLSMPTDTELALSASAKQDGVWVNLYEMAVGVARNDLKPEQERSALSLDAVAHGGSAGTILALITGHDITRFSFKHFKDGSLTADEKAAKLKSLREQLSAAVREKRLMTCGTALTTIPGITPNHAYAILNFDEKTDSLELWNPHGTRFTPKGPPSPANGYPREAGIFSIPLIDFVQQFSAVAFEKIGADK